MAAPMIDTAWKPDGALGAVYAGENAAYSEQAQQLDVIRQFLANQREQQMQPLDIQKAQWEAASAQDKLNDPAYREWMRKGYVGQMKSQDAAGNNAQVLAPFKQRAEQATLENEGRRQNLLYTMSDIDEKLRNGGSNDEQGNFVPFSSQDKDTMGKLRQQIMTDLATTPEFYQKHTLQDERLDSAEAIAKARNEAALAAAKLRFEQQQKDPKYKEQLAAAYKLMADPNATPEQQQQAQMFITYDIQSRIASNPTAYQEGIDISALTKGKVPTKPAPVQQVQPNNTAPGAGVNKDPLNIKGK